MVRSLPQDCPACTVENRANLTLCHDHGDRLCRAATDEAFRRDTSNIAAHAGIPHYVLSRWRQSIDDLLSSPAKVRRVVLALSAIGRTFAEREAFLRPINEAAGGVLLPAESATEVGKPLGELLGDAMRASTALHASVVASLEDGQISEAEYAQIESYVNANRTSDALLLRRAQALCARPLRGKAFAKPTKSRA